MNNKTCGECKHYLTKMFHCQKYDVMAESHQTCEDFEPKKKPTVFDKITESVETLAPRFVEKQPDKWDDDDYPYYSYLTKDWYATEDKAIAATLEELKKEVKDE